MRKLGIGALLALSVFTTGCEKTSRSATGNDTAETLASNDVSKAAKPNPAEQIVPQMPPVPDLSTVEGRTEAAIIDQLACKKHPRAAKAINAMLRNKLLEETEDSGDGNFVYVPIKPLSVFGFPLLRVTGWQMKEDSGDGEPPFIRVPGTPPPNFFAVTVRANPRQIRSALAALHILEETQQADWDRGIKRIPGVVIRDGDMWEVKKKLSGVVTLECSTNPIDFDD